MFKLSKTPLRVVWPVSVKVPSEAGEAVEHAVKIVYSVPTAITPGTPLLLKDAIVGWEGVADETGQALEFTPEHRDAALANPFFFQACDQGLAQIFRGEFQRGN